MAWGTTAISRVGRFYFPLLQKLLLFPVTEKAQAEQRGSWQTAGLTKRKLCEAKSAQHCANTRTHKILQTHTRFLIHPVDSYLSYDRVARVAQGSDLQDPPESACPSHFHIPGSWSLHKNLRKAPAFPDLSILNSVFKIWTLLKELRLMLLCSSTSCLKK